MAANSTHFDIAKFDASGLVTLLRKLGKVLEETPKENRSANSKNHYGETVTGVDFEIQGEIVLFLYNLYPDHIITGEEETGHPCRTEFKLPLSPDQFYWTIDPIDGTTNWAAGKDTYAIAVGLQRGTTPIFGIVYFPATGTFFIGGCAVPPSITSHPVTSRKIYDPDNVAINYGLGKRRTLAEGEALIASLGAVSRQLQRLGCASRAIYGVSVGEVDAYISYKEVWTNIGSLYAIVKDKGFYINIDPATLDLNKDFCLIVATPEFAANHLRPGSELANLLGEHKRSSEISSNVPISNLAENEPVLYRFSIYTIFSRLGTPKRIAAIKAWSKFAGWRQAHVDLLADRKFLERFPKREQDGLRLHGRRVSNVSDRWERRGPVWTWIHWPIYMVLLPILVSVAYGIIGEFTFEIRSDAYYLILILTVLSYSTAPEINAETFRRLHNDTWATLPVQTVMAVIVAIPVCRFLYSAPWYIALSIIGTYILVTWLQYYDRFSRWWRKRRGRDLSEEGIGADAEIVRWLDRLEDPLIEYKRDFGGYRCGAVHNTQDLIMKESGGEIIAILWSCLSPSAREARPLKTCDGLVMALEAERRVKRGFTWAYLVLAALNILTLVFQWGSFAQAFMALYAVGVMLWLMDRNSNYSVETYLDYATPKFAFMIWSMLHTNVPLLEYFIRYFSDEDRRTRLFQENRELGWILWGSMLLTTFLLNDLVVYYAKSYLKRRFAAQPIV